MALGYCMRCDKLTAIRPGAQKWGSRECAWYPVAHEAPDGGPCPGEKIEIKSNNPREGMGPP